MSRKQAPIHVFVRDLWSSIRVSLLVWFLRAGGVKVDFYIIIWDHRYYCRWLIICFLGVVLPVLVTINLVSNKF